MKILDHVRWIFDDQPNNTTLSLPGASIRDNHIPDLVALLNSNPRIVKLEIAGNQFRHNGAKELAKLRYVKDLDVTHTNICDEGAIALMQGSSFTRLNVSRCSLTDITAGVYLKPDIKLALVADYNIDISDGNMLAIKEKHDRIIKSQAETSVISGNRRMSSPPPNSSAHAFFTAIQATSSSSSASAPSSPGKYVSATVN